MNSSGSSESHISFDVGNWTFRQLVPERRLGDFLLWDKMVQAQGAGLFGSMRHMPNIPGSAASNSRAVQGNRRASSEQEASVNGLELCEDNYGVVNHLLQTVEARFPCWTGI